VEAPSLTYTIPLPYILHPKPCTVNYELYTINHELYTINHTAVVRENGGLGNGGVEAPVSSLHPTPYLYATSYTINYAPKTINHTPSAINRKPSHTKQLFERTEDWGVVGWKRHATQGQVSGFRVQGSGFRVQGLGFRVQEFREASLSQAAAVSAG